MSIKMMMEVNWNECIGLPQSIV